MALVQEKSLNKKIDDSILILSRPVLWEIDR